MTDRFPFMRMYKNIADRLPNKDDQADFYRLLVEYALDDKEPDEDTVAAAVFECARQVIDNWKVKQRNGSKGGRPKTEDKPNENQAETKEEPKSQEDDLGLKNQNQGETKVEKTKGRKGEKKKSSQEVLDLYNSICVSLPRARTLTDQRISHISARLHDHGIDEIRAVFERANRSSFLAGRKGSWRADFDWLMNENNMVKVLEGRYDDRESTEAVQEQERAEAGRKAQAENEARLEAEHREEMERIKRENPERWAEIEEKAKHMTSIKEVLHEFS